MTYFKYSRKEIASKIGTFMGWSGFEDIRKNLLATSSKKSEKEDDDMRIEFEYTNPPKKSECKHIWTIGKDVDSYCTKCGISESKKSEKEGCQCDECTHIDDADYTTASPDSQIEPPKNIKYLNSDLKRWVREVTNRLNNL